MTASTTPLIASPPAYSGPANPTTSRALEAEVLGRPRRRALAVPRPISRLLGVVVVLLAWQVASSSGVLSPLVIGSPRAVLATAGDLIGSGELTSAVSTSLRRVVIGLAIGLSAGLVLALVSGLSRLGEDVVDAPLQMLRTVPVVGLVPLLIVWLGVGETPKVVLIAVAVTFPVYINLVAGIRNSDPTLVEAGRSLGLSRAGLVAHVILPGALPQTLVGLRLGLGVSWLALVFAEQISAVDGLGYLMTTSQQLMRTDAIVVCLLVYALLGLATDLIVRGLERWLLVWRPKVAR